MYEDWVDFILTIEKFSENVITVYSNVNFSKVKGQKMVVFWFLPTIFPNVEVGVPFFTDMNL